MLTMFDADEYEYEALGAGVSGFLLKDARPSNWSPRSARLVPARAVSATRSRNGPVGFRPTRAPTVHTGPAAADNIGLANQ